MAKEEGGWVEWRVNVSFDSAGGDDGVSEFGKHGTVQDSAGKVATVFVAESGLATITLDDGTVLADRQNGEGLIKALRNAFQKGLTMAVSRKEIAKYVQAVTSGKPHSRGIVLSVTHKNKDAAVAKWSGIAISGAIEILLNTDVAHIAEKHPDLDQSDWEWLAKVVESPDAIIGSEKKGRNGMPRVVFIAKDEGFVYAYVADVATGGKGSRLNMVTYFKDKPNNLIASLRQNGVTNKDALDFVEALLFRTEEPAPLSQAYSQRTAEAAGDDLLSSSAPDDSTTSKNVTQARP